MYSWLGVSELDLMLQSGKQGVDLRFGEHVLRDVAHARAHEICVLCQHQSSLKSELPLDKVCQSARPMEGPRRSKYRRISDMAVDLDPAVSIPRSHIGHVCR